MHKYSLTFLCGFISGFSLLITSNTLNYWLSCENVDIKLVGAFSLISLPYAINFIWAPIIDALQIPILFKFFGQRLSWIYLLLILLSISVFCLSYINPVKNLAGIAICAFLVSIINSSQDTALGAFRSEILESSKQGSVAGIYTVGYRAGMLLSGSGAIVASNYIDWQDIYKIFAIIVLCFVPVMAILVSLKNKDEGTNNNFEIGNKIYLKEEVLYANFKSKIINRLKPLLAISNYKGFLLILIFLVLYRLPDNFIYTMINPFLLNIGFNAIEIATVGKLFGVMSAILGGIIASYIMNRMSILNSLLYFGIIHAIAHSFFIIQNMAGNNLVLLFVVMGFESITSGMIMAAYIAFITSLCKGEYRATQYAFFSSMMGLSRAVLPSLSGLIVSKYGWQVFYFFTSVATIPSLAIICLIKRNNYILVNK